MKKQQTKTISFLAVSILFTILSHPLFAAESLQPEQTEKDRELEHVLVTARLEPISIGDIGSSVTVITSEEIEQKQVKYLSELLRDVPGFSVSQAGGAGSQTQVRVRGAEANQLLVLMDGVRANDPAASGEFQYQFALTSNIERIEIIRGPQSATWGSDAVAGVINIIRKKDVENQYLSANVEAGSFDSFNAGVDGGYSGKVFQITGGLSYLDTDGTNVARTGNENDGAENTTGNIALEFDAGDAFSLRFSGQWIDATSEYDDFDYFVTGLPEDADRVTESNQNFLTGELRYKPLQNPWSGSFSVNRMNSDNDNLSDGLWTSSTAATTLDYRLRAGVVLDEAKNHSLGFALEHQNIDFSQRGEATMYGDPNQDQSYDINAYAAEYIGKPITGFTWTASIRLDDYSDFDNATTWQLAASYQLSSTLRLRGSAGTGSKAPTFTERYGFFEDFFIGNPDLKPESSRGWEVGLDTRWSNDLYQFELVYFDQDLRDEIDGFVFDPDTFMFTAQNKDSDSTRKGVEAVFNARLGKSFTLVATYTYTNAREKNALGQSVPEVRRPKNLASLSTNYYFAGSRGNLNLNLNYSGSQQDDFFSPVTFVAERVDIDPYTVVNLAGSWKLTNSLELTARISNLFDKVYEEVLGFVRPGRAVYAGVKGRFNF
ncbi:MAG: TonB-dependent receptor [Xanthomonadales bacterium]|nr:TonB-dependent receptor [Xanthomonadales bacterium]